MRSIAVQLPVQLKGNGMARGMLAMVCGIALLPVALAAPGDGSWRCFANGNIPIGTLTMSGDAYEFMVTKTVDFQTPNPDDAGSGSGQVEWSGTVFTPLSGPLKDEFGVTGGMTADGLSLNNARGALMGCILRD